MAIEITFDEIDQKSQDEYADITVPLGDGKTATLVHLLRMTDEKQDEFSAFFKDSKKAIDKAKDSEESDEADEAGDIKSGVEQARDLLRIIVATDEEADALFALLGTDMTRYNALVAIYMDKVNPGEA